MDKKKIVKTSIIVSIVLLIMAIMFLYTKNDSVREFFDVHIFRKDVYEDKLPCIRIESNGSNIYACNNSIMVIEQNCLKAYNKMGYDEYSIDIKATSPIFDSNGSYMAIADKGGKNIYLISGRNMIWQKELEENISNICVNRNGYVSVTVSDASYKTIIETYDNTGMQLFKTYLANSNVVDIDISDDNKYLAIAEANLSGITIQSNIKIVSIENAKKNPADSIVYTHIAKADELIINIEYNNKNSLICMYDGHVDRIKDNENIEINNFESDNALFVDVNLDSNIAKVVKTNTGLFNPKAELQIINNNDTSSIIKCELEEIPKSVYTYGNIICLNMGTEVLFFNTNGWLIKKYKSSQEAQNVILCNDLAGIAYKNKIELISL